MAPIRFDGPGPTPNFPEPGGSGPTPHSPREAMGDSNDQKFSPPLHLPGAARANALRRAQAIQSIQQEARASLKEAMKILLQSQFFTFLSNDALSIYLRTERASIDKDETTLGLGADLERAKDQSLTEALRRTEHFFWALVAIAMQGIVDPIDRAVGDLWDHLPEDTIPILEQHASIWASALDRMIFHVENQDDAICRAYDNEEEQFLHHAKVAGKVAKDFLQEWDNTFKAARAAIGGFAF
ncbi:MAG TPA: hypothetical protein VEC35_25795 [Noviherbaspirillum sp.]|nr:hypothetical protein [Noviherbaspirillum sp.]